jgi:Flp pilus assembly pilin Flp
MKILKRLWADEIGVVMSAETVMLGTMGVLAMTAGVGTMATAVNSELGEMGQAFRGFDQSFSTPGFRTSFGGSSGGGGAGGFSGNSAGLSGTMGSGYTQQPAAISQAQLDIQFQQMQVVDQELAGRVIQRLDAAQLQQLQQFSDQRDGVCSGSSL